MDDLPEELRYYLPPEGTSSLEIGSRRQPVVFFRKALTSFDSRILPEALPENLLLESHSDVWCSFDN